MSRNPSPRVGFTLVELLVVITIIGMLIALLLPAVGAARDRAALLQCLNNIQNIGKATINNTSQRGVLPGYVQAISRSDKTYVQISGSLNNATYASTPGTTAADKALSRISWAARILPQMDGEAIWERMVSPISAVPEQVRQFGPYICPRDSELSSSPDNAGMSYVFNTAGWDTNDSGTYVGDTTDNGLAHNLTLGSVSSKLENIKDGSSTTLMLSENIQKNSNYCWMGVPSTELGEQHFGMVWVASQSPQTASQTTVYYQAGFNEDAPSYPSNLPAFARPNSNHAAGVFNVVFADGSGRNIAAEISYDVYQRLLTANGRKCVDTSDPAANPASTAIQYFRSRPPLTENDYNK
jgi:prepilin-type N-terminal cleavage/methylation domain-containing protein